MARANRRPTTTTNTATIEPPISVELAVRDAITDTIRCFLEVAAHKERGAEHSTIAAGHSLRAMLEGSCMNNEDREKLMGRVELECKASAFKLLKRFAKQGHDGTIRLDAVKWPEIEIGGGDTSKVIIPETWDQRLTVLPRILNDKKEPIDTYRKFYDHILPTKDDKSLKRIAKALADHDNLSKTEQKAVERIKSDLQTKRGVQKIKDIDVARNTDNYRIIGNVDDIDKIDDK